jgi:uncharacterized protein (DUF488 family)
VQVWTVGHSTHPVDEFIALLRHQRIDVLADVRSRPYSRHNPQFGREKLKGALAEAGLGYVYLGAELGGKPPTPERFPGGLERLLTGAASYRVAIMCSEEDPVRCHRRLLITPALVEAGVEVLHLRGDGRVVPEADLASGPEQETLFG